jgi:hypothetical protein
MSDYKIEFTLRQHTPMIHFQHDQKGATLRSTEIKPKLDKFIIEQITNIYDNYEAAQKAFKVTHSDWLVGKGKAEHIALDYKIKISGQNTMLNLIEQGQNKIQFFANMGADYVERPKSLSNSHETFKLEITSYNTVLLSAVQPLFSLFLSRTNFGSRQNKGYGSFFINGRMPSIPNAPYLEINSKNFDDIMLVINYYYQRLKSGINYCYIDRNTGEVKHNEYQHSFLKLYLSNSKSLISSEWEKKWLKIKFLGLKDDDKTRHFSRALLGLPYAFQFIPKISACNQNHEHEIYPSQKIEIDVSQPKEVKEISRIKSPITFKPIRLENSTIIFIIIEKQDQTVLLNRPFEFKQKRSIKTETLNTPSVPLDITDLVNEYNKHLGATFLASNFIGKKINVTLHP